MNPIIKAFDTKNLSQIVDFVKPMLEDSAKIMERSFLFVAETK